jgi:hypothetical protein
MLGEDDGSVGQIEVEYVPGRYPCGDAGGDDRAG